MDNNDLKIGLICVALEGERLDLAEVFQREAINAVTGAGMQIVNKDAPYTLSAEDVLKQAKECREKGALTIVYLIGTWILANHIIDAVLETDIPTCIWGIPEPVSFSSVGLNVLHGTLEEMNIKHRMFYGEPGDGQTVGEILAFVKACGLKYSLKKARMGLIGGKSISAYPTGADTSQIKSVFGTEIDHLDQIELLERARGADTKLVKALCEELKARYEVEADENLLYKAASVSIALEQIQAEYGYDCLSVKCLGEFINTYTCCCVAVALLNEKGFTTSCQGNINATLSMFLLSKLSGNPAYFGDIGAVYMEDKTARIINCGSISPNLAKEGEVRLVDQYEYMGAGRGVCTLFCCKPGDVTFGTLGRRNGNYVMNIASGKAYEQPLPELTRVRNWAQGFVKLDGDPHSFFNSILSNHSALCYGTYVKELTEFCKLAGVTPELNV